MDVSQIPDFVVGLIEILSLLFIFAIGIGLLWVAVLYVHDKTQTESTLKRNYPVIARFRYLFEHLGEFFRQYFFALDREKCRLTGQSVPGFTGPRKMWILQLRLVLPVISGPQARSIL